MTDEGKTAANKQLVEKFYQQCVVRADFTDWEKLVRKDYIQHSPLAEDGVEGLMRFAKQFLSEHPQITMTFKKIIAEGDLVVTHGHAVRHPGDHGISVIDIFRVQDGLVAEHWEAFVDVPETTISGRGLF